MTGDAARKPYPRALLLTFAASLALTACGMVASMVVPLLVRGPDAVTPMIATGAGLLLMYATLGRAQAMREGRAGVDRTFDDRVEVAYLCSAATLLACLTLAFALPSALGWGTLSVMCAATAVSLCSSVYLSVREHLGRRHQGRG